MLETNICNAPFLYVRKQMVSKLKLLFFDARTVSSMSQQGFVVREDARRNAREQLDAMLRSLAADPRFTAVIGWIDRNRAIAETLTGIKRAGAQIVLTYWAAEVAAELSAGRDFS